LTSDGTPNSAIAESNLTFDGQTLTVPVINSLTPSYGSFPLAPNVIQNSAMIRTGSQEEPLGWILETVVGSATIKAVSAFTKAFEGVYAPDSASYLTGPASDSAGISNPYWYGSYYKGVRLSPGGLADGWGGHGAGETGNILQLSGSGFTTASNSHLVIRMPMDQFITGYLWLFQCWVKISTGSNFCIGSDAGWYGTGNWPNPVSKSVTDASTDGWYRYSRIIQTAQLSNTAGNALLMTIQPDENGNVEGYVALPYLAVTTTTGVNQDSWNGSILDKLTDKGLWVVDNTIKIPSGSAANYVLISEADGRAHWGPQSLIDTGSLATTGSNTFIGNQNISGSLYVSESIIAGGPVFRIGNMPALFVSDSFALANNRVDSNNYAGFNLTMAQQTMDTSFGGYGWSSLNQWFFNTASNTILPLFSFGSEGNLPDSGIVPTYNMYIYDQNRYTYPMKVMGSGSAIAPGDYGRIILTGPLSIFGNESLSGSLEVSGALTAQSIISTTGYYDYISIGSASVNAKLNIWDGGTPSSQVRIMAGLPIDTYWLDVRTFYPQAGVVNWAFDTMNAGTTSSNALVFNGLNGYVGLGIANPDARLSVSGTIRITNALPWNFLVLNYSGAATNCKKWDVIQESNALTLRLLSDDEATASNFLKMVRNYGGDGLSGYYVGIADRLVVGSLDGPSVGSTILSVSGNVLITGDTNLSSSLRIKDNVSGGRIFLHDFYDDTKYWTIRSSYTYTDPDLTFSVLGDQGEKTAVRFDSSGRVLINKEWDPNDVKLSVSGNVSITGSLMMSDNLTAVSGTFTGELFARVKHFKVDDKENPGSYIIYSSLEGPENGVYVRGKISDINNTYSIDLPKEWTWLVDNKTITVNITSENEYQELYYKDKISKENKIFVYNNLNNGIHCSYIIFGERKDVPKLIARN
jgi:hypothetical protein